MSSRALSHTLIRWAPRVALVCILIAAPWPFGSVTPRSASILASALFGLYGAYSALRLARGKSFSLPPALFWIGAGLGFVALQQAPLPPSAVGLVAPAVADLYEPLRTELGADGWHPISVEPFQSLWTFVQLLALACAFSLANRLFRESSERNLLVYALVFVGVALSLFAVYQKARFGTLLYGRVEVESATPFGPFVNHNHFAGFVEACLLATLGAAIGTFRRHGSLGLFLGGTAVLMGIAHLLSHSRGGLLALGCGLATLAWLFRGNKEHDRVLLVAGGVAVLSFLFVFAPSSFFQRLETFGSPATDDSVQFRLRLWEDSLALASRSPALGTGLGTYAAAVPPYRRGPDETRAEHAESDWLQLLCEGGLVAIVLGIGFLASVVRSGYREIVADPSASSRGIRQGAFAAAVALLAHGFVDFNFRIPSNALLFAVLLGLVAPAGKRVTWASGRLRLRRWAGAALAVALSFGLVRYTLLLGESEHANRKVNPLLTEPDEFTELIQQLSMSRERLPSNPETHYLLGRLYNEEAYRSRDQRRYRELRLSQASAAFRDSLHRAPARGRTWFELAWAEANLKNDEQADRWFELALTLEPHWANLRANYALYLVSRGRIDEALAQIESGRRLKPGLSAMDALNVIGPYIGDDPVSLRRAAGEGPDGDAALARFLKSTE